MQHTASILLVAKGATLRPEIVLYPADPAQLLDSPTGVPRGVGAEVEPGARVAGALVGPRVLEVT